MMLRRQQVPYDSTKQFEFLLAEPVLHASRSADRGASALKSIDCRHSSG
jgi:hypothetical protein